MAAQTIKTVTATQFVEMRTTEAGDRSLVLLVTYTGGSQEKVTFPIETAVPA
ncbi:MAG TPA: hypothetical protein VHA73_14410 [Acidimicrobiales bacterium]|jgi:hypothetical protein|nr:hypothetical protein [Acidimicrobiales bacterium]